MLETTIEAIANQKPYSSFELERYISAYNQELLTPNDCATLIFELSKLKNGNVQIAELLYHMNPTTKELSSIYEALDKNSPFHSPIL